MASMPTLSRPIPIVCGGIGVITPTAGVVIPTMVGDGTVGTVRAGASVGAAGTAVDGGDIIIIIIIPDITTAVTGVVITGVAVTGHTMLIPTDAPTVQAVLPTWAIEVCHLQLAVPLL